MPYVLFYVRREFFISSPLWRRFPKKPRPSGTSLDNDKDDDDQDDVERTKENWANVPCESRSEQTNSQMKRKKQEIAGLPLALRNRETRKIRPLLSHILYPWLFIVAKSYNLVRSVIRPRSLSRLDKPLRRLLRRDWDDKHNFVVTSLIAWACFSSRFIRWLKSMQFLQISSMSVEERSIGTSVLMYVLYLATNYFHDFSHHVSFLTTLIAYISLVREVPLLHF